MPTPTLADGVELLGEYQGSGLRESPYLARRPDGRVVQLTPLLYAIAARADGRRDAAAIATEIDEQLGRRLSPRDVAMLVDERLAPVGIVTTGENGAAAVVPPSAAAPFALRVRAAFVPAGAVRVLAAILRPLFAGPIVGAVLAWLIVLDAWLALRHGLDAAVREVIAAPGLLLLVYGLAIAGTFFHELGHAAACRYGGARPGRLGAGLYYVWPVFYTDVTDAYRLDRRGRIRTDLGGVYFNAVFALLLAGAYFRTGLEPLLLVILLQHVQAAQQLVPWLRLDGYYVLTDLVGIPDVLSRIRPIVASLVPGREPDPRVTELKPWVRAVVSAYVLVTVPALAFAYGFLLYHAPAFFETALGALRTQLSLAGAAWDAQEFVSLALAAVHAFALLVPLVGVTFVLASTAGRIARMLLARVTPPPVLRTAASFGAGVGVAGLLFAGFTGARLVTETGGEGAQRPAARSSKPSRPVKASPSPPPRPRPRPHPAPRVTARTTIATPRPPSVSTRRRARPVPQPAPTTTEEKETSPVEEPPSETVTQTVVETTTESTTVDTGTGASTTMPTTTTEPEQP